MPSPVTITKLSLRQQAADHLIYADAQRELVGLALEGKDLAAAAAHGANVARAMRQFTSIITALSENERVSA